MSSAIKLAIIWDYEVVEKPKHNEIEWTNIKMQDIMYIWLVPNL